MDSKMEEFKNGVGAMAEMALLFMRAAIGASDAARGHASDPGIYGGHDLRGQEHDTAGGHINGRQHFGPAAAIPGAGAEKLLEKQCEKAHSAAPETVEKARKYHNTPDERISLRRPWQELLEVT